MIPDIEIPSRTLSLTRETTTMLEEYMAQAEYLTHFEDLRGLRARIARALPVKQDSRILDVATGEGYFAIAVAQAHGSVTVTGIDLSRSVVRDARRNVRQQQVHDRVTIVHGDATQIRFPDSQFDMAVNFTGLDEVAITRGADGVRKTFFEVNRVLKPRAYFGLVVMPPDAMETEAQQLEVAVFRYICGATYPRSDVYDVILADSHLKLRATRSYYSGMKFTPQQAKREIRYTIEAMPRIYGVTTPPFDDVWSTFGHRIKVHGLGCYSKVVLMLAQKVGETDEL